MTSIFLKTKTVGCGETHISLAGGKYKIKETELTTFYEHLVEDYKNGKDYYIVEKISQPFKFYVDVEKAEEDKDIDISTIAKEYQKQLLRFLDIEEQQTEYLILYKESGDKNRAHIHYPNCHLKTKNEAKFLRECVVKSLNIKNKKTIDESAYNTGLRIIGAKKTRGEDKSAYVPDGGVTVDNLCKFSIRCAKGTIVNAFKDNSLLRNRNKAQTKEDVEADECLIQDDKGIVEQLVSCLSRERIDNYNTWIKLGILLYCLGKQHKKNYLTLWEAVSKKSDKYETGLCSKSWATFESLGYNNYHLNTLRYWAIEDNEEKYNDLVKTNTIENIRRSIGGSHSAIASLLYTLNYNKFIVDKHGDWWIFNDENGIWSRVSNQKKELHIAIDELKPRLRDASIDCDCVEKLKFDGIIAKLGNVSFKASVINEMTWRFENNKVVFDNCPFLIGFANGVFDLKEGVFRKAKFEEYISKTTGYNFEERNTTRIEQILSEIMPNERVRRYLLKYLSKSLDGIPKHEFHIWSGWQGANGKSFLCSLLDKAFGDYSERGATSLIVGEREDSSSANSALMKLKGSRVVYFQEPSRKKQINVSVLKELSGGDILTARELHKSQDTFQLYANLIACCNMLPNLDSIDGGVKRRLRIINFSSRFVENPTKPNEYLINPDYELSHVKEEIGKELMSLLIKYYYEKNISLPEEVTRNTTEYINENDPIVEFVNDNLERCEDGHVLKSDLKDYWKSYFKKNFRLSEFYKAIEIVCEGEFLRGKMINNERLIDVMFGWRMREYETEG